MKNTKYTESEQYEFERIKRRAIAHLDGLLAKEHNKGIIFDYNQWADIINDKVIDFHEYRGVYPNILIAKKLTYTKLEKYFKDHPEIGVIEPAQDEQSNDTHFDTDKYSLYFCIDTEKKLKVNEFILIYDEAPIFDGESKEPGVVKYRLVA